MVETVRSSIESHLRLQDPHAPLAFRQCTPNYLLTTEREYPLVIADMTLSHTKENDTNEPILVLEVGFSERYDDLYESAQLWLRSNSSTKAFILFKIEEIPRYRCPLKLKDFIHQPYSSPPIPMKPTVRDFSLSDPSDEYSPLTLNGEKWVGTMEAFWEVWVRDGEGNPTRLGERTVSQLSS